VVSLGGRNTPDKSEVSDEENCQLDKQELEHQGPQEEDKQEEELPQDILAALGRGDKDTNLYGEEINPEIIKIISVILTDGLEKEVYENLRKVIKIPKNAKLLDAPKLNSEFSGLLFNSMSHRDNLLKERQQDLGQGIALITQSINKLTKQDFDRLEVIKNLSDSMRLLSNLHHNYTQIRRKLIVPQLDKSLSQNLNENNRSEFLYSQLEEAVKTSSAIKRTINILKPKNVSKNYQHPRRQTNQAQNQQTRNIAHNAHYKPSPYQASHGQPYKPHHRNYPRTTQQARPAQRPRPANRGGRAKYP
jgi:hypothetical protein